MPNDLPGIEPYVSLHSRLSKGLISLALLLIFANTPIQVPPIPEPGAEGTMPTPGMMLGYGGIGSYGGNGSKVYIQLLSVTSCWS